MRTPFLAYASLFSFFLPVYVGALRYRTLGTGGKAFFFFCLLQALGSGIEKMTAKMGANNHLFANLLFDCETIGAIIVFYFFVKNVQLRRLAWILSIVFVTTCAGSALLANTREAFNEAVIFLGGGIQILLSGLLVYLAFNVRATHYTKNPLFWIGSSLLLYNAGTLIIFSFGNALLKLGLEMFITAWHINWSLLIFSNLLFAYSFIFLRNE